MDDEFTIGRKVKIELKDMNTIGWRQDLTHDFMILKTLLYEMNKVTPADDLKLQELIKVIGNKVEKPLNGDNKKVINMAIKNLDSREKVIMELRYGFDGKNELTQKEVADKLGISQSYISRIEKKVIERLKKQFNGSK